MEESINRLEYIYKNVVCKITEDEFNFKDFVSESKDGCGTVCCILGWFPKYIPEAGFEWCKSTTGLHLGVNDKIVKDLNITEIDVIYHLLLAYLYPSFNRTTATNDDMVKYYTIREIAFYLFYSSAYDYKFNLPAFDTNNISLSEMKSIWQNTIKALKKYNEHLIRKDELDLSSFETSIETFE